ncbi:MAG: cupin domain-containing protein [Sulfitobacter sp.]|nr:cupin domain-containing protein [Sulfitobacter sp.]
MPKIDIPKWSEHAGGIHPVVGLDNGAYADIPLGDLVGLSQFGVHLERLPPGSRSSFRHWHEAEDEFIYVISGELLLIEDDEVLLTAGDAAGWKAGEPIAHCLENRSDRDAVMLVVGARAKNDVVHYPDHDLKLHRSGKDRTFTRSDGSSVE